MHYRCEEVAFVERLKGMHELSAGTKKGSPLERGVRGWH